MPGDPIQIGPFLGGLNTFSDPTAVADNELVECLNFELDLDGSLKSRPPFVNIDVPLPLGATGNMNLLGYYYAAGGVPYLLASDGLSSTYYFSGSSWVLLTNTMAASAMTQFDNKAWLVAAVGAANPGGYWTPGGGFIAEPNMPRGDVIVAHKFRLWVATGRDATVNGTRLYFSEVLGTTPFWKVVPNFLDVGAGDGQNIVKVIVYYNSLLIFRTDSIYSFQYTSDPAAGQTNLIIPGVGLSDRDTVVAYESFLYFMYDDRAYEFINNRVTQINIKVPFIALSRTGLYKSFAVSVFNNRIIFSYYDTMYVFSMKTRTWTRWRSAVHGPIGKVVERVSTSDMNEAIVQSTRSVPLGGSRSAPTLLVTDGVTTAAEPMRCIAQTKNYNYEVSSAYKRLFWWGVDAVFRGEVVAVVTPITFNYSVTWGALRTMGATWGLLLDYTWGQPISGTLSIETIRDTSGTGSLRKFVKFLKSLRFRQANFRVDFECDGSISTAPVRLFSLMTYVKAKERVSKPVT